MSLEKRGWSLAKMNLLTDFYGFSTKIARVLVTIVDADTVILYTDRTFL